MAARLAHGVDPAGDRCCGGLGRRRRLLSDQQQPGAPGGWLWGWNGHGNGPAAGRRQARSGGAARGRGSRLRRCCSARADAAPPIGGPANVGPVEAGTGLSPLVQCPPLSSTSRNLQPSLAGLAATCNTCCKAIQVQQPGRQPRRALQVSRAASQFLPLHTSPPCPCCGLGASSLSR